MSRSNQAAAPAFRPVLEHTVRVIREQFDGLHGSLPRMLEVGCGTRSLLGTSLRASGYSFMVHGLDIDEYALANTEVDKVFIGSAESMPFEDESYDVVVAQFLLEHVPDYRKVVAEMARVTAKGGVVLLIFPNPFSPEGFVTRVTPFWFHVYFRKAVERFPKAAMHNTFPTVFSFRSVGSVLRGLTMSGMRTARSEYFAEMHLRFVKRPVLGALASAYSRVITALSLDVFKSSVLVIARK